MPDDVDFLLSPRSPDSPSVSSPLRPPSVKRVNPPDLLLLRAISRALRAFGAFEAFGASEAFGAFDNDNLDNFDNFSQNKNKLSEEMNIKLSQIDWSKLDINIFQKSRHKNEHLYFIVFVYNFPRQIF